MSNKKIELLVALLPAIFFLTLAIFTYWIFPLVVFDTAPMVSSSSHGTGTLMVQAVFAPAIKMLQAVFKVVAMLLLILAIFEAMRGLIGYFQWLTNKSPACPLCGSMMVVKTARRGKYRGQQFWGCGRHFVGGCQGKIHIG